MEKSQNYYMGNVERGARAWLMLCPSSRKKGLETLIGTLSAEEADEMQSCIDKEFSNIESELNIGEKTI